MPPQELIDYIKKRSEQDVSQSKIQRELLDTGWTKEQIKNGFSYLRGQSNKSEGGSFGKVGKVLISIIIVLLIGGGAFGYLFLTGNESSTSQSNQEKEVKSETELKPKEQIRQSTQKIAELDFVSAKTDLEVNFEDTSLDNKFQAKAEVTSKMDKPDQEIKLDIQTDLDLVQGGSQMLKQEFKGNLLAVNNKLFGKLKKGTELSNIPMMAGGLNSSKLTGNYILLSEDIKKESSPNNFPGKTNLQKEFGKSLKEDISDEKRKEIAQYIGEQIWQQKVVEVANTEKDQLEEKKVKKHSLNFNLVNLIDVIDSLEKEYEEYFELSKKTETDVYYCVDSEGNYGKYDGEEINKKGTTCSEVFPKGEFTGERSGFSPFDTQVEATLTQIGPAAESYASSNDKSYKGFPESESAKELRKKLQNCSANIMDQDQYPIQTSKEEYAAWGALCDAEEARESIIKQLADSLQVDATVWTDSEYLHKLEATVDYSKGEIFNNAEFELNITTNYDDFGKSVDLEEPDNYMTFEELMGGPSQSEPKSQDGQPSPAQLEAFDDQISSQLTQIRLEAEHFYLAEGETYKGFKESSGWTTTAKEIPLCSVAIMETEGMNKESYPINLSSKEWVSYAPLCNETGKADTIVWKCVDSTVSGGEYKNLTDREALSCGKVFGSKF